MMLLRSEEPVDKWVKYWLADLEVASSIPGVGSVFNCKRGSFEHNGSLLPFQYPDINEIQ